MAKATKKAPEPPMSREEYIESRIAKTLARNGPVPKWLADEMRRTLRFALTSHPQGQAFISRLRPRPEVEVSDEVPIQEGDSAGAESKGTRK